MRRSSDVEVEHWETVGSTGRRNSCINSSGRSYLYCFSSTGQSCAQKVGLLVVSQSKSVLRRWWEASIVLQPHRSTSISSGFRAMRGPPKRKQPVDVTVVGYVKHSTLKTESFFGAAKTLSHREVGASSTSNKLHAPYAGSGVELHYSAAPIAAA